jgi:hypothetical protein
MVTQAQILRCLIDEVLFSDGEDDHTFADGK